MKKKGRREQSEGNETRAAATPQPKKSSNAEKRRDAHPNTETPKTAKKNSGAKQTPDKCEEKCGSSRRAKRNS